MVSGVQQKAPWLIPSLIRDLGLTDVQAAAIVGNLAYESGNFRYYQEIHPVGGGRGGAGWAQWTGKRRDLFEAWCKLRGLDPKSDEGSYSYLIHELKGSEAKAVAALKATSTLEGGVRAFEVEFERAGVKAYPSREKFARVGLLAYQAGPAPQPEPQPEPQPIPPISGEDEDFAWGIVDAAVANAWTRAQNPLVFAAQMALVSLYYSLRHGPDGIFGDHTEAAVRQFQADEGLAVDGKVGPHTWAALMAALKDKSDA